MPKVNKINWKLFQDDIVSPEGEDYHAMNIIPNFGKEHSRFPSCWCHPETEELPENQIIITHEIMH